MLVFANSKINLGLDVLRKRPDGYHDLSTVMLPVDGLRDAVELLPAQASLLKVSGLAVDCDPESNLCMRALRLMQRECDVGEIRINLHKNIPSGAGLGGGSSDAAAVITGLNALCGLGLPAARMESMAAELGSDVPFFIASRTATVSGRGEVLGPVDEALLEQLEGRYLMIIKPDVSVGTARAYAGIRPEEPAIPLGRRLKADLSAWRETVSNTFEKHTLSAYPHLGVLKWALYEMGAVYASMSGSGSALYGIFCRPPRTDLLPSDLFVHKQVIPRMESYRGPESV